MAELREAGALGFSDDGLPIRSAADHAPGAAIPAALRRRHRPARGGPRALRRPGSCTRAPSRPRLGLAGIPRVSESTMIARDAAIAGYEEARIHIQHLSAAESVEAVRAAKDAGVRISGEATPHHLCLTEEEVRSLDPRRFKMNPPLRAEARSPGADRGPPRRHHRLHRHRPRAARERGKGSPLRAGGDGGDRAGDGLRRDPHRARPAGGDRARRS